MLFGIRPSTSPSDLVIFFLALALNTSFQNTSNLEHEYGCNFSDIYLNFWYLEKSHDYLPLKFQTNIQIE